MVRYDNMIPVITVSYLEIYFLFGCSFHPVMSPAAPAAGGGGRPAPASLRTDHLRAHAPIPWKEMIRVCFTRTVLEFSFILQDSFDTVYVRYR